MTAPTHNMQQIAQVQGKSVQENGQPRVVWPLISRYCEVCGQKSRVSTAGAVSVAEAECDRQAVQVLSGVGVGRRVGVVETGLGETDTGSHDQT